MSAHFTTIRCSLIAVTMFLLFTSPLSAAQQKKPTLLLLQHHTPYWSGMEVHTLNRYKKLLEHGFPTCFLVHKDSKMASILKEINQEALFFSKPLQTIAEIAKDILAVCKTYHIDIVLANTAKNLVATKFVAQQLPIKIIYTHHMHVPVGPAHLQNIDAAIGVGPHIAAMLQNLNSKHKLDIKHIDFIPPFFDEDKFLNFKSTQTREAFFKDTFGIAIKNMPILCTIANMYADRNHKNHPLLLHALHKLIHEKNKPAHMMLAGNGPRKQELEALAQKLNLTDYVHFLGTVTQTPALLYHSDFHVLPSKQEAFGQVHIEAALMKKPSIGATQTGATAIIQDGITGLLFENNSIDDLCNKIELLIDNPALCQSMGAAAYQRARSEFANELQFKKLEHAINFVRS